MNPDAAEIREEQAKAFLKLASPERFGSTNLNHIGQVFYDIYRIFLEASEKEKGLVHQLYNPEKEWRDNRYWVVEEMKRGNFPDRETLTTYADRALLNEAWSDYLEYMQRENERQKRMAKTALLNFTNYEFFWHRLKANWLYFLPKERIKILTELTSFKWGERLPREVTSIIENAQLMLEFDFKLGREPEKHEISREEGEYILDFAFSEGDLGKILLGMYRRESGSAQ